MKTVSIKTGLIYGSNESFAILSHGADTLANFSIVGSPFSAEQRALRVAEALRGFTHVKVNDGKRAKLSPAKYWFALYDTRGTYLMRLHDPEAHFMDYQVACGYLVKVRRLDEVALYPCDWVDQWGEPTNKGQRVFEVTK